MNVLYPLLQQIQRLQQKLYGLILVKDDDTVAHDSKTEAPFTKCFFSEFKRSGIVYLPFIKTVKYLITSTASATASVAEQLPPHLNQE